MVQSEKLLCKTDHALNRRRAWSVLVSKNFWPNIFHCNVGVKFCCARLQNTGPLICMSTLNSKNYYYYYLSGCTEGSDVFVLQSFFKATRRLYIEIDISHLRRSEPDIYTTLSCCNPGLHGFKISIFFAPPECTRWHFCQSIVWLISYKTIFV